MALLLVIPLATACGGAAKPHRVPDVRGLRLDVAERDLEARGLDWEELGGGTLGVVVRSNWTVCDQRPHAGTRARTVRLIVERTCPPAELSAVPDVEYESLEDAAEELEDLGIAWSAHTPDGDRPLVLHLWEVCSQDPEPGATAPSVELYVERDCWDD